MMQNNLGAVQWFLQQQPSLAHGVVVRIVKNLPTDPSLCIGCSGSQVHALLQPGPGLPHQGGDRGSPFNGLPSAMPLGGITTVGAITTT